MFFLFVRKLGSLFCENYSEHSRQQIVHHSPRCLDKYREAETESSREKYAPEPPTLFTGLVTFGQCSTKTSKAPAKQNKKDLDFYQDKYSSKIKMITAVILLCHSKLGSRFLSTVCHK